MASLYADNRSVEPVDHSTFVGDPAKIALSGYFKHNDTVIVVENADAEKSADDLGRGKG